MSTIWLNLASAKEKDFVVPYAINAIVIKHFVNLETYRGIIDVNFIGRYKLVFSEFIDKLLKIKSANTKVTVYESEVDQLDNAEKYDLDSSSIVIFDSVNVLKKVRLK